MAIPEITRQIDTLYSSTWDALIETDFVDNIYKARPFLYWIWSKNRMKTQVGGLQIKERLKYGMNQTFKFLAKGDSLSTEKAELITNSFWDWKRGGANMIRYWADDQVNTGTEQIASMVEDDIEDTKIAVESGMEKLLVTGDGTADGGKAPDGLINIISKTPTTGTVGGIDAATQSWWRNTSKAATGIAALTLFKDTDNMLNTLSRTSGANGQMSGIPDLALTSQTVYELYQQELKKLYTLAPTDNNIPFPNVQYRGTSIMWSPENDAVELEVRFINSKFLRWIDDPRYHLKTTEWKAIPDQINDRMCQIMVVGNLVCSNRSAQGVLHTIKVS